MIFFIKKIASNRYVKNTPIEELEPSIYIANAARKQKKAEYDTDDDHDKLLQTKQNKPDPNLKVKSIRVAVVGQPNVGKSSLINNILNYERTLVSYITHICVFFFWIF